MAAAYLAAFAAGLTIAALDVELCDCFLEYGGVTAEMMLLFTFVLFGSSLIWSGFTVMSGATLLFRGRGDFDSASCLPAFTSGFQSGLAWATADRLVWPARSQLITADSLTDFRRTARKRTALSDLLSGSAALSSFTRWFSNHSGAGFAATSAA